MRSFRQSCARPVAAHLRVIRFVVRALCGVAIAALASPALHAQDAAPAVEDVAASQDQPADSVYLNAKVETMNHYRPRAQAIAVRGSLIVAVGSASEIRPYIGPETKVTDLHGATVLPGFIDPHGHMLGYAFYLDRQRWTDVSAVNLYFKPAPSDSRCKTPSDPQQCFIPVHNDDEVLDRLRRAVRAQGATGAFGANYDVSRLGHSPSCPGGATKVGFACPNLEDGHARERLDAISSTLPVFVTAESGHIAYANSTSLRELNICGVFDNQDQTGCYAPVYNPAQETALAKAGQLDEDLTLYAEGYYDAKFLKEDPAGTAAHVIEGAAIYAQHGYTLNQEGAAGLFEVGLYLAAKRLDPDFPLASAMMMYNASLDFSLTINDAREAQKLIDAFPRLTSEHRLFIGGVKSFADGSPQGYTADLSQPYANLYTPFTWPVFPKPYTGLPDSTEADLAKRALAAHQAGYPLMIHQNGDQAITNAIGGLSAAHAIDGADARDIVLHAPFMTKETQARIAKLDDPISYLISNLYFFALPLCQQVLGPDYVTKKYVPYAAASAINAGLRVTLHSDSPVDPPDPLFMIWVAKTRNVQQPSWYPNTDPRQCPTVLAPEESLSIRRGVEAFTFNAAWQYGLEKQMGTIDPGKFADLVFMSLDPLDMEETPDLLKTIRIYGTVHHGAFTPNPHAYEPPIWPG